MRQVATFTIRYLQCLDEAGRPCAPLPVFAVNPDNLVYLYEAMVFVRLFDAKAVALQRTGQLGTFASCLGQEAIGVAVGSAMQPTDVLLPSYRDYAAMLRRGVRPEEILLYWGGDERGNDFQGPREDFPITIPIATQIAHAAGVALAFQIRREARVAVCTFGDGATSKGDFYEALNAAGVWKLPLVLVCNNNQYAISMPCCRQTGAQTLAQKAIAGGIEGLQVDGNDVVAMYEAVSQGLEKARAGGGPTLIEALSYRLSDHTTADDASRYRDEAEVKQAWQRDPILRLRTYLASLGIWNAEKEKALLQDCHARVQVAVDRYLEVPQPKPEAMFDFVYATLPKSLALQRQVFEESSGA